MAVMIIISWAIKTKSMILTNEKSHILFYQNKINVNTSINVWRKKKCMDISFFIFFVFIRNLEKKIILKIYYSWFGDMIISVDLLRKDDRLIVFFQGIFHIYFVMLHHYTSFHIICLFFRAAQSNPTSRTELLL